MKRRLALIALAAASIPLGVAQASHLHLETKLVPSLSDDFDWSGYSIAMDGDTVVIGAPFCDGRTNTNGCAYVFRRLDTGVWVEEQRLEAVDGTPEDRFGRTVAVHGDTMAIGAYGTPVVRRDEVGVVFVYRRHGTTWVQEDRLEGFSYYQNFGFSVDVHGDLLAVGSVGAEPVGYRSGLVDLYRRIEGAGWIPVATLVPPDAAAGDEFGRDVAVSDARLFVGAPFDDDRGTSSGSVYVYAEDGEGNWVQEAKLLTPDGAAGDQLGRALDAEGDRLVAGVPFDDDRGSSSGSTYVFRHDGAAWVLERKLVAEDGTGSDQFGAAVSLRGETLVVGSPFDDDRGGNSGSAYLFVLTPSGWVADGKRTATDGSAGDEFGFSVSVAEDAMAVGARRDDPQGIDSGAGYTYERTFGNQPPDADAGPDADWECASEQGGQVTLDGSGSTDPDSNPGTNDDIVLFEWFLDFGEPGQTPLGEGEVIVVALPLGSHAVTLRVTDRSGLQDTDLVLHSVVDTLPPDLTVAVDPEELWPPNHRMVAVAAQATATDNCGVPSVVLHSIDSSEPDNGTGTGDGNTTGDIRGAAYGTEDYAFELRAERDGTGPGRTYTVRYSATDPFGNEAVVGAPVFVPHDRGGKTDPLDETVDENGAGTVVSWTAVDGAMSYDVIRGTLSAIRETPDEIDLGTVSCIENESTDESTVGREDPEIPPSGDAFFYLVEYYDGTSSSYGTESAPKPRVAHTGVCQ